ncbi:MAG: hypothetical protein NVS9B7_24600 [Flavisolibacter sp.]
MFTLSYSQKRYHNNYPKYVNHIEREEDDEHNYDQATIVIKKMTAIIVEEDAMIMMKKMKAGVRGDIKRSKYINLILL